MCQPPASLDQVPGMREILEPCTTGLIVTWSPCLEGLREWHLVQLRLLRSVAKGNADHLVVMGPRSRSVFTEFPDGMLW